MLGVVAACSASDIPVVKDVKERDMTIAQVPEREEVLRGDEDPPIVTLNLKSGLRERRLSQTEELPSDVYIPTTNLNAVPVTAALQAVLSGTDISLSWNTGSFGSRLVTVMNLRGPLPKVVQKICSAAKVFCTLRHGSIELSEKETFVVSIPPVVRSIASASAVSSSSSSSAASSSGGSNTSNTNASNSIVEAINKLLDGDKATVDEQGGNIVYTATVDTEERVSRYLAELRTERPLIVLQMYIWEVTLNRENAQGINWSSFTSEISKNATLNLTNNLTSAVATRGSVSLGAVTSGIISANAIASFIATKGRVQTISNPQLTFVSGSTASLRVGGTQRYISQVGTNISSNVSGNAGTSATNSSTNTVSTDSIDTGLAISIAGSYENGVVFANLDLSIRSLVDIGTTSSGGGTINLPTTADEKMNTVLRVRPGDSLVLAGYVTSSDNSITQGLPAGSTSAIPLYGDETRSNRELVMIVKPSIVLFSDKEGEPVKKKTASGLPQPIIVDKDGSRPLPSQNKPALTPVRTRDDDPEPEPVNIEVKNVFPPIKRPTPQPAIMMPSLSDMPTTEIGASDTDFSHAFDKLLR
jgi:Flp pilus assembly secretin CpaC